jgi:putative holliday junction resolvase
VRTLCLDVGDKRIGVAVSDKGQSIAQPVKVYQRVSVRKDIEEIGRLIRELEVSRLVCGLPRNLDGSVGQSAQKVVEFAQKVEGEVGLSVEFWDERFSSDEAHRIFDMQEYTQKKRKAFIDMVAAQIILQGFLDAHKKG